MTVADLIRELQALPNSNAEVRMRIDTSGDHDPAPNWDDVAVDDVRNEGPYISMRYRA